MKVRVLHGWDGLGKPYAPGAIVDMDDLEASGRLAHGHVEVVDAGEASGIEPPADPRAAGDDAGGGDGGEDEDAAEPIRALVAAKSRDELNLDALDLGIDDPESFPNKTELARAILIHTKGADGGYAEEATAS